MDNLQRENLCTDVMNDKLIHLFWNNFEVVYCKSIGIGNVKPLMQNLNIQIKLEKVRMGEIE